MSAESAVAPAAARTLDDALAQLPTIIMGDESLESLLLRISRITKEIVPGAIEVSVTLVEGGEPSTAAFTGQITVDPDERQYATGQGPCLDAVPSADTLVIEDTIPGVFDPDTVEPAETFAGYGAVAVANLQRHGASAKLARRAETPEPRGVMAPPGAHPRL